MHCAKCFFYETDVGDETCNRCGRAYVPEANVYLGLLVLATAGMAWTLRHLLTGDTDSFVRPPADLGRWVMWPVSIVDCPAYGFVIGAWLGVLGAAPILTGIMYGKRGGWLLTILLAALGPSLWMAAAVALGVWVSAGWTLRLTSKLSSALLGLIPVAIYWFAATVLPEFLKAEGPAAAGATAPAETGLALVPALHALAYVAPVTAAAVAVAVAALVAAVGWAEQWHVRWPGILLAVLTAGPAPALLATVGVDRIHYGMFLEEGPVVRAEGPTAEMGRLREFLDRRPASPLAAEARARFAMNLERLEILARPEAKPPRPSKEVWQELLEKNTDSPWAADARLHLGDAAARQGFPDRAEALYREVVAQKIPAAPAVQDPLARFSVFRDLFSIGAQLQAKEDADHLQEVRNVALMRRAVLLDNHDARQGDNRALALFFVALGLKGTNGYREALLAVREADPKGALADNAAYDLAAFETSPAKRIEQLRAAAAAFPGTDGAMLARLAAARELIELAKSDPGSMREAEQHLVEVQKDLAARKTRNPADPYVAALADHVEKELVYVQAQLRTPKADR